MFHAVMPVRELDQLVEIVGETVDEVRSDLWAVTLLTRRGATTFIPEEVATPIPLFQSADVERLRVASEPLGTIPHERVRNLGRIDGVDVLTTVVGFTITGPERHLAFDYRMPGSVEATSGDAELDLGVVLRCSNLGGLFVSTRGFFAEFAVGGLKHDRGRLQQCERTPLIELRAKRAV